MVNSHIISQIQNDFQFVKENPAIKGIILFGSYAKDQETTRSDIDICVVAPNQHLYSIHKYLYANLENNIGIYDIRFFEELPLYIQGDIIEKGIIALTPNPVKLSEYFYPFRKQWNHEKWRIMVNS